MSIHKFLKRLEIPEFDVNKFIISSYKPISIGIAISGGGYRSFLNGAGALAAFDDRSLNSTLPGHLGGILQSTSYISAISGGSWILMSTILSDYEPIVKMKKEWQMFEPLLEGIPNLKQVEVSRNDVQVLPLDFKDDDSGFYDRLYNIEKRSNDADFDFTGVVENSVDDDHAEDDDEVFSEMFEAFYNGLEWLPDIDDEDDDGDEEAEVAFVLKERNVHGKDKSSILVKRDVSKTTTDDWFEGFKSFFKDMFKKKEEPKISATNILPNIEMSSNLSLKNMKKIFNFYKNLHVEVRSKKSAGFPVSFTDYWGRALSRKIFPRIARSPNKTFSMIVEMESFKNHYQPLPIIVSNLREPGVKKSSITSTIFEFTPFEFGSWDLKMFMNLKFLGSLLCGGSPVFHLSQKPICFNNFDNCGFITGTSSSLFNNVLIYVWQLAATSTKDKYRAIKAVLNTFGLTSQQSGSGIDPKKHPDYALYTPNPFFKFGDPTNEIFNNRHLYMVDGGEDGQNIPIQPLIQTERQVDLIFALDSTADVEGWPNGTIILNTMERYHSNFHKGTLISINGVKKSIDLIPKIPNPKTFISKKLNKKPVFFGCHLSQFPQRGVIIGDDDNNEVDSFLPPIIGYFANTPHSYNSNTSTFKLTYNDEEISKVIENSYNIMTYANSSIDSNYYKCVGCIMIKREFDRRERNVSLGISDEITPPKFCETCYKEYCYN